MMIIIISYRYSSTRSSFQTRAQPKDALWRVGSPRMKRIPKTYNLDIREEKQTDSKLRWPGGGKSFHPGQVCSKNRASQRWRKEEGRGKGMENKNGRNLLCATTLWCCTVLFQPFVQLVVSVV